MLNLDNCDFCEDMEDINDLKLYTQTRLGYGALYEEVDEAKFCPICGRRLPDSEVRQNKMKREILFRGKRLDNGEWVYGGYAEWGNVQHVIITKGEYGKNNSYEVDPETVGQYTGLLDCKVNKIFEGDILCFIDIDYNTETYYGIVKFGIYNSLVYDANNQGFYVDWKGVQYRNDLGYWAKQSNCWIVGNIHDNPEFMEMTQNDD